MPGKYHKIRHIDPAITIYVTGYYRLAHQPAKV